MSARRIAMFAPVAPSPSGIADYVEDLLGVLPSDWDIEVFAPEVGEAEYRRPVRPVEEWDERAAEAPFDLNVYHVGNNSLHLSTLPVVKAHPGLLVLHDVVMHPARADEFLAGDDFVGYAAAVGEGAQDPDGHLAATITSGLGGPSLYWNLALSEDLVRASRHAVVHGEMLARWLRVQLPGTDIGSVAHWLDVREVDTARVQLWRDKLGASDETPLLGTFGYVGAEHRADLILSAVGALAAERDVRLVVVGRVDPDLRLAEAAKTLGLEEKVTFTGRVDADDYGALLRAVDLGVNLRYPTARASSGPLVQLLQVGTPAVIHDLVHLRDLPDAAVVRVPTGSAEDEATALSVALREWFDDPARRESAASAALEWSAKYRSRDAMRDTYETAVARALESQ